MKIFSTLIFIVMLLNSLTNVVNEPTRFNALLQPIVINEGLNFLDAGSFVVPDHISNHSATFITLPFQYEPESPFKILSGYITKLIIMPLMFDWSGLSHGSVNEASYLFNDIFIEIV